MMWDTFQQWFELSGRTHFLPLLWLFSGGLLLGAMPKLQCRWHRYNVLILVLPLVLWSAFRGDIGDTWSYIQQYQNAPETLTQLLSDRIPDSGDPGFLMLMSLCKQLGLRDHRSFFLLIALVQMLGIGSVFRKYSPDIRLSLFLFVASTDYISWMFNGTRQFLAVTITFAAFPLLVHRRFFSFLLAVLASSLFHASALLMLPVALVIHGRALNGKVLAVLFGTILLLPFADRFTPLLGRLLSGTPYDAIVNNEIWLADDGTHPIRVLVYAVPFLMAIPGLRHVRRADSPVVSLCVNASAITTALYLLSMVTSGIYVGRLPIYTTLYGYIILPWLLDEIFEPSSARLMRGMMVAGYLLFFGYQMRVIWGLL